MSATDQKELATQYCDEIDEYLGQLEENSSSKREDIISSLNRLTITSAILPIIVTFASVYAYILTQQVITAFASLVDVIPPILINNTKSRMRHYNNCANLKLEFTGLKGDINRLASLDQLKDQYLAEVDSKLKHLNTALGSLLQIT